MLFHYQLGFPARCRLRFGTLQLDWSRHALRECQADRYGIIHPPTHLDTNTAQVIEAEIEKQETGMLWTKKVVYRIPYEGTKDMVLVVIPQLNRPSPVKTVWINQRTDLHFTLDETKYVRPDAI
jgi:hypothetical protein